MIDIERFVVERFERGAPSDAVMACDVTAELKRAGGSGSGGVTGRAMKRIREVHGARRDPANVLWGVRVRL